MYFLHRVEIDPCRRRAAQPRSPARENFRRRVNHAFRSGIPLQRDTHTLRRLSHPACASAGIPVLFRLPHPARASAGIPILFCRQPPPRPRLRQRILRHFFGLLHPARAAGAGSVPGRISEEQPCPALLRDLPVHWTVGISPLGERLTGRGNLFPLPCLPHFNHLTSRQHPLPAPPPAATHALLPAAPTPPTPSVGDTHTLLPAPPPHPRLRRSSPTPAGGRGSERRYPVGSRIRGGAWWAAVPGSSPAVLLIRVLHGLA